LVKINKEDLMRKVKGNGKKTSKKSINKVSHVIFIVKGVPIHHSIIQEELEKELVNNHSYTAYDDINKLPPDELKMIKTGEISCYFLTVNHGAIKRKLCKFA
jgi:hypothetical protein